MRDKQRSYDPHEQCKAEITFWRRQLEEHATIREVVRRVWSEAEPRTHHYEVLKVLQVDAFHDGLRIVVE